MSERQVRYFPVSWDQLHRDAKALAACRSDLGPYDRVHFVEGDITGLAVDAIVNAIRAQADEDGGLHFDAVRRILVNATRSA